MDSEGLVDGVAGRDELGRLRAFWTIWGGQAVSLAGSQAVQFALIWWLTVQTRDARILTLATALGLLPQVVLGPLIGVFVDRWNRKKIMWIADAGVALAAAGLAFLFASGRANPVQVLILLFLRALGAAFHAPAMLASTTLMVPPSRLNRVQGLNQGLQGLMQVLTPPLGALLIGILSMALVMCVDVVTALAALIPLMLIAIPQPSTTPGSPEERQRVIPAFIEGLGFLRNRTGHLLLVSMSAAINLFLVPAFSLLPLLVENSLKGEAVDLAWLTSAFGLGMLLGGLAVSVWRGPEKRIVSVLAGVGALGISVLAVGILPLRLPFLTAAILAVGLAAPFVNGPAQVILQTTIPPEMQGRVFSLITSLAGLTAPLGLGVAGFAAEWLGLRSWYVGAGLTCLALSLVGSLCRPLREIEETGTVQDGS